MNTALKNYKFGQKNNWRQTVWNEVLRRVGTRIQHEFILYLAGSQDIDREIAKRHDVPLKNLIAIDRCQRNIFRVRDTGGYGVVGEARTILQSWPVQKPVCAVLLDFSCGLTMDVLRLHNEMALPMFRNTIWVVNVQRGRDASHNKWREAMDEVLRDPASGYKNVIGKKFENPLLHRGFHFGIRAMFEAMLPFRVAPELPYPIEMIWTAIWDSLANPKFYSYQSGVVVYDSIVTNSFYQWLEQQNNENPNYVQMFDDVLHKWNPISPVIKRRIAATMATRTRQQNHIGVQ